MLLYSYKSVHEMWSLTLIVDEVIMILIYLASIWC